MVELSSLVHELPPLHLFVFNLSHSAAVLYSFLFYVVIFMGIILLNLVTTSSLNKIFSFLILIVTTLYMQYLTSIFNSCFFIFIHLFIYFYYHLNFIMGRVSRHLELELSYWIFFWGASIRWVLLLLFFCP